MLTQAHSIKSKRPEPEHELTISIRFKDLERDYREAGRILTEMQHQLQTVTDESKELKKEKEEIENFASDLEIQVDSLQKKCGIVNLS